MNRATPRRSGIKGVPRRQNLYIVNHELLKQMAGQHSYSAFVDELIVREDRRRKKREVNDTLNVDSTVKNSNPMSL